MDEQQPTAFPFPLVNYWIKRSQGAQCQTCQTPAMFVIEYYFDLMEIINARNARNADLVHTMRIVQLRALRDQMDNKFTLYHCGYRCEACTMHVIKAHIKNFDLSTTHGRTSLSAIPGSLVLGNYAHSFVNLDGAFTTEMPIELTTMDDLLEVLRRATLIDHD